MKFRATVIPSGNATGVEVPDKVMQAIGDQARPPVRITINGHNWRSRVAAMRGMRLIGISAANRKAAGITLGETIEVDIAIDEESREVDEPSDLSRALDTSPQTRAAFERLAFGLKRKYVKHIEDAKGADTRQRRIDKLIADVGISGDR